jgi:hypothetical protein
MKRHVLILGAGFGGLELATGVHARARRKRWQAEPPPCSASERAWGGARGSRESPEDDFLGHFR